MGNIKIKKRSGDTVYLGLNSSGIKLTGDSGSGGSSDFSTATITVVNNLGTEITLYCASLDNSDPSVPVPPSTRFEFSVLGGMSADVNVIMYKGTAFMQCPQTNEVVLSGNITNTLNGFLATGDGTMIIGTSGGGHPVG